MEDRLTGDECRKLLGSASDGLTPDEVLALRDDLYEVANTISDAYADVMRRASLLDPAGVKETNWVAAALGLSSEDLAEIEADLDEENLAEYGDAVWGNREE